MTVLAKRIHTFGRATLERHGERVHKRSRSTPASPAPTATAAAPSATTNHSTRKVLATRFGSTTARAVPVLACHGFFGGGERIAAGAVVPPRNARIWSIAKLMNLLNLQ